MFKYWNPVRVTSWFYEGIEWVVKEQLWLLEIHRIDWKIDFVQEFWVSLTTLWPEEIRYEVFRESDLELIENKTGAEEMVDILTEHAKEQTKDFMYEIQLWKPN